MHNFSTNFHSTKTNVQTIISIIFIMKKKKSNNYAPIQYIYIVHRRGKKKKMKSFPFNLLLSLSNRGKKVLIVLIERTRDDIRLSLREEKGNRLWMFLSDILSHPRFHVCRNVLPHERHPRLRVRLSGQDNDTKC